ncbi:hypothetical protein ACJ72_01554 [Emergomyces africanus]|uniref:Uncharacterized protein n=1 Tax=Emergomyces africanus TaxID=1955775 RepID=A0A1B7P4X4_9EURO|nr:hypothetical protein ACJ72_01554 [Emergomyces africanus]
MATFTYYITSPGPADGSPSPQLHTVHLLEAYPPDPQSDEEPQHLLPMPMPKPVALFSASGNLSKDAASNAHLSPSNVTDGPLNRQESTPPLASDNHECNTSKKLLNYSNDSIEAHPHSSEERYILVH